MSRLPKIIFFAFIVRPLVLVILGLNIYNREKLPAKGPAVIAANHNSHLDTMVLMSLFPISQLHKIRPVAAADYFLKNRLMAWFSLNVIGIIPLDRSTQADRDELFKGCENALDQGDILILFPEGSRGEPEKITRLKKGIYHLLKQRNETPIIPIIMHGLGRALPKGEALFVPFNCDVIIGEALFADTSADNLISQLEARYNDLMSHCLTQNSLD